LKPAEKISVQAFIQHTLPEKKHTLVQVRARNASAVCNQMMSTWVLCLPGSSSTVCKKKRWSRNWWKRRDRLKRTSDMQTIYHHWVWHDSQICPQITSDTFQLARTQFWRKKLKIRDTGLIPGPAPQGGLSQIWIPGSVICGGLM
jgi:hypothetical protein